MSTDNQCSMKGPTDLIGISEVKLMAQAFKKLCEKFTGQKASLQSCLHQVSRLFGFESFHHLSVYEKENEIVLIKASPDNLKFFEIEDIQDEPHEIPGFRHVMEQLNNLGVKK